MWLYPILFTILSDKLDCEYNFWKEFTKRKSNTDSWFRRLYTEGFSLTYSDFENKKVVDIGCGPTGSLEWMDNARSRTCVDPLANEYMFMGADQHKMLYIASNAEQTKIANASVDVVSSSNNLDHVDNYKKVLKEIHRVLRPGGWFLLVVEIHPYPQRCEPIVIPWSITEEIKDIGFTVDYVRHSEGYKQKSVTDAIFNMPIFDHNNKKTRKGWLVGRFRKI
jgi:ubiquinone/menaquinone biosynthesis C-methylase UbiE